MVAFTQPHPAALAPRRAPAQKRSAEREQAILEATLALLAEEDFHALTTKRIAERAGVPIGSIYYLFPNKYAILIRLFERNMERIQAALAEVSFEAQWEDVLDDTIDRLAAYWDAEKGFVELWHAIKYTPELKEADAESDRRAEALCFAFLQNMDHTCSDAALRTAARIMLHATSRILLESIRQEDRAEGQALVDGLKVMLKRFVAEYVEPHGSDHGTKR